MHFLVVGKGVRNGSRGRRSDHHWNGEESRLLDGLRGQMEAALLHVANNVLRFKHARKRTIIAYLRNDALVLGKSMR